MKNATCLHFSPYFKDTAINIEITSLAGGAYGIFARVGDDERAQRASEISETNNECENSVQAPAHEEIYLFHTY